MGGPQWAKQNKHYDNQGETGNGNGTTNHAERLQDSAALSGVGWCRARWASKDTKACHMRATACHKRGIA